MIAGTARITTIRDAPGASTSKGGRMSVKNEHGLTPQQERFAVDVSLGSSQAEAYRRAFPASLRWKDESVWVRASQLMANAKVQQRVKDLMAKAAAANDITTERVLKEVARLAFMDIRKLVRPDGTPKPMTEIDDDTAAAIAGLEVATVGNMEMGVGEILKFKLADKKGALDMLMRHLGAYERDNAQKPSEIREIRLVGFRPDDKAG